MACGETWAVLVVYGRLVLTIPLVLIYILLACAVIVDKKCSNYIGKNPFILVLLAFIFTNTADVIEAFIDLIVYTPTTSSIQNFRLFTTMIVPFFVLLVILDKFLNVIGVGMSNICHIFFVLVTAFCIGAEFIFFKSTENDFTSIVTFLLAVVSTVILVGYHIVEHHKAVPPSIVEPGESVESEPQSPSRKRYFNVFGWSLIVQLLLSVVFKVFLDVSNIFSETTCYQLINYGLLYGLYFMIQWVLQMLTVLFLLTSQTKISVKIKRKISSMHKKRDAKIANVMGVENTGMPEGGITNFGSHMRKF